jgi:hypothetical protein
MDHSKMPDEYWVRVRRKWLYDPALWFSYRMVEVAYLDAYNQGPRPSDEALLARDWIATSQPVPGCADGEYVSFPECCERLGLNEDAERMGLLDAIDAGGEFDTDRAWERLEVLSQSEPKDDLEPLFDAYRVVPALDQFNLLALLGA